MSNEEFILMLSQKYYKSLYHYIKKICIDQDLVQDIVQETFLLAHQKADRLQKHEDVKGWLFQTARYKMLHMVNDILYYEELEKISDKVSDPASFEDDHIVILDVYPEIRKHLNPAELNLFIRHYEEGYHYRELAEENHISQDSIKMRMQRIKKKLQNKLKEYWSVP